MMDFFTFSQFEIIVCLVTFVESELREEVRSSDVHLIINNLIVILNVS